MAMHTSGAVDFRSYKHIFADSTQMSPRDEIKLGYESGFKMIEFNPGEETYFHFPLMPMSDIASGDERGISGMPISATNMVRDGAICGIAPYCSDRVYVHNAGYEFKDKWGNYKPEILQNGEWLCTWLSGDITDPENAVWVDRWYDAVNAKKYHIDLEGIQKPGASAVVDIPSNLRFAYGCQYRYDRIGTNDIKEFVKNIDLDYTSALLIDIDDWAMSGCYNSAPSGSDLIVRNRYCQEDMFFERKVNEDRDDGDYGVKFNGNASIQIDRSRKTSPASGDFTAMAFIEHDDWDNSRGLGIIDSGYHGGWQISYTPKPKNTLVAILGKEEAEGDTPGHPSIQTLSIYNSDFELIGKRPIALTATEALCKNVCIDDEYYTWGVTKGGNLVKIDVDGNYVSQHSFPGSASDSTELHMLGDKYYGLLWVGGEVADMISMEMSSATSAHTYGPNVRCGNSSWYEITNYDTGEGILRELNSTDPDPCVAEVKPEDGLSIVAITVDSEGNVFLLQYGESAGKAAIVKYIKGKNGHYIRIKRTELTTKYGQPVNAIMTTTYRNGKMEDVINVVFYKGFVSSFDTALNRLWNKNISKNSEYIDSAVNNYEWGRRFCNACLYVRVTVGPQEELVKSDGGQKLYVKVPRSRMSNRDWHHVALVKEGAKSGNRVFKLLLNGIVEKEFKYSYPFVMSVGYPSIVLGGECGFGADLRTERRISNAYWDGSMDDFRFYKSALTDNDIRFIQLLKYDIPPMHWNMEIADKYYIEGIRRTYKMKMPGAKSTVYDIVVNGYNGGSEGIDSVKEKMSGIIQDSLPMVSPAYTENARVVFNGD